VSFQSRIKSKGIFSDELAILEKVNKEKAVFFKELSGECQKDRLSHIARSLAVKGLVDLCVTKRKASRKSRSDFMLVSPEKEKVKLEAILQNPKVLEKAYDDYLEELREISPHAQVLPYKMKVPLTLEHFKELMEKKYLYLHKRGLPEKNMKVEGIAANEKGRAFEAFIKQTVTDIVEKMNKEEISPSKALKEITKFKEVCYARFNELFVSSSRLEHGKGHDPQHSPGGREGNIEQIDQRKAQ